MLVQAQLAMDLAATEYDSSLLSEDRFTAAVAAIANQDVTRAMRGLPPFDKALDKTRLKHQLEMGVKKKG